MVAFTLSLPHTEILFARCTALVFEMGILDTSVDGGRMVEGTYLWQVDTGEGVRLEEETESIKGWTMLLHFKINKHWHSQ